MRQTGIYRNHFTFSAILPACANSLAVSHGQQVHSLIVKHGFKSDVFVGSALIDMYAKCSSIDSAKDVFAEMPERNLVSWNSLIVGCSQNKLYERAVCVFREVLKEVTITLDQVTCTEGNKISNRYENMRDLTVEIQGDVASLEDCLEQFSVKEWLDGDNMYKCDGWYGIVFTIPSILHME